MIINWNSVIEGTVTGIVGAAVFWIIAYIRQQIRNWWLRKRLNKELSSISCGHGLQGVNTSVNNRLQKSFIVRDVCLVTSTALYAFNATGEVSSCPPPDRKIARDIKKRLKKGEMVNISTHIANRSWMKKPDHAGFVEVTPYTGQGFILPLNLMENLDGELLHLSITIEYVTWDEKTKLLTVATKGWAVDHMRKTIEHVSSELENGRLNQGRAVFGLPPVPFKKKSKAPNQSPEPTTMPVTATASHPSRQP